MPDAPPPRVDIQCQEDDGVRWELASAAPHPALAGHMVVDDVDVHHARAVKAGAEIFMPPEDASYGGRGYGCKDPEGNVWSFGTYDPWTAEH